MRNVGVSGFSHIGNLLARSICALALLASCRSNGTGKPTTDSVVASQARPLTGVMRRGAGNMSASSSSA